MITTRATLLATCLLMAGCTLGQDFAPPSAALPDSFRDRGQGQAVRVAPVAKPIDTAWWGVFGDPVLSSLIARLATENADVRIAAVRLSESRAQRGVTAAALQPSVDANGSYSREAESAHGVAALFGGGGAASSNGLGGTTNGVKIPSTASRPFDLFQTGFDASWELDLWGRVRRSVETADAAVQVSAETQRDVLLSMTAELASDYLTLRGTQATLEITRANLANAQQSAALTQERQGAGLATDLDFENANALVSATAAQIPSLEQREQSLIGSITLLLGQSPGALDAVLLTKQPAPVATPQIPVGLPSELAHRRPDIRSAEAQLHQATASIGAAEADFYPRITLSGSGAIQALQFHDLGSWSSRTFGFGPAVSLPIFDGGKLRSTLELRKQEQQEAALTYQQTVLRAWHEVDDALYALSAEQRRQVLLADQVVHARRAATLAETRYGQGLADFLEVLTALRTQLAAESDLATSAAAINTNLVALYKALGGGWESALPEKAS